VKKTRSTTTLAFQRAMKRLWRDRAFRRRRSRAVSRFMKRRWKDERFRQHISDAMLAKWQEPEHRRTVSEAARLQWQNPALRRRMEAAMRRPWRDPIHVARMSRISKARWRDPRYRPALLANSIRNLGPSRGACALHSLLGTGWHLEYWTPYGPIDIAHPALKLAIEVDDPGHRRTKQRQRDQRKSRGLRTLGWSLFRITETACGVLPKNGVRP
jgi:hypothetical protein